MNKRKLVTDRGNGMTKIVINCCYGGFSISEDALKRYYELKGKELLFEDSGDWGHTKVYYYMEDGRKNYFGPHDIEDRTDPVLIQVIEELGKDANGLGSDLVINELEAGTRYFIDEYDGMETIVTENLIDWSVDRKSTRLNSSHTDISRMPSSA